MSKLSTIYSSLSFKVFLILLITVVFSFTMYGFFSARNQSQLLENQVKMSATRASDIIKRSLYTYMLLNEREKTHDNIRMIGQEPGVEVVRIYNKKGEITFSSQDREIGTIVDMKAEACYACHVADQPLQKLSIQEKARIYTKDRAYRVLGLINPIENRPECASADCHAHSPDQTVLGVLDVQMSMKDLDQAVATTRNKAVTMAISIAAVMMFLIALILFFAIYVPTKKLRKGTEMVAEGNLDYRIDLVRNDELGMLAQSFNRMSENLKEADQEVRAWSRTLEQRVEEKTEELEEMHRGMVQVEKMASLGRLSATVAHELNNPLSGIVTYAKLLMRKIQRLLPENEETPEIMEELDLIRAESQRCGNIVKDLLIFARESSTDFHPAQLHQIIERALKLMGHHLELGEIALRRELDLENDRIVCDQDKLVQALVAIMMNAVEAMPEGGQLTVGSRELPAAGTGMVQVWVGDTGVGMPEELTDKIFDPFFSTKNETKGVGLGLAVVYGIIQRHHGQIRVESTVGKGTTFYFNLPRQIPQAETSENPTVSEGYRYEK